MITFTNIYKFGSTEVSHETGRTHARRDDAISDIIDYCDGEYIGTLVQTGYDYCLVSFLEAAEERAEEEKTVWLEEMANRRALTARMGRGTI